MPIVRNVVNKLMLSVFIEGQMLAANPSIAPRFSFSLGGVSLARSKMPRGNYCKRSSKKWARSS